MEDVIDVGVEEHEYGGVDEPHRRGSRRASSGGDDDARQDPPTGDESTGDESTGRRRRRRQTVHPDLHVREHDEIDPFDRPFLNPLTATIDLSGLRRRLAMEDLGRIDFEPRLYGKPRDAPFDPEGTQILRRPGPHGTPGRGIDVPTNRIPGLMDGSGLAAVASTPTRPVNCTTACTTWPTSRSRPSGGTGR